MTAWIDHALWWHAYPLGFVGAPAQRDDGHVAHRLPRLEHWLDYLIGLGANGLALGPIFAATSHGYDTLDYYRIDPRLGDEEDFRSLVDAAHERGIRIMLDGVFHHVSTDHPAFREAVSGGPASPAASMFRLYWNDSRSPDYEHFEGHRDLVSLNHADAQVADLVADVMCHWLERGADAWRLDAAYAVPADFWASVIPRVRQRFPDAYFVGEMIHGDYSGYVAESTLDSVTQYELWKSIWSSLNDVNFHELAWNLARHNEFLDTFVPLTFLGNHDVTRIASRVTDERHLPHALAILMTVGGTPSIYAGDELGFVGVKEDRPGGDDAVRPEFPPYPRDIPGGAILDLYREFIALRRRHPWLHRARTRIVEVANDRVVYASETDGMAIAVALSLSDEAWTWDGAHVGRVLAGGATLSGTRVSLPPHGWAVFELLHLDSNQEPLD